MFSLIQTFFLTALALRVLSSPAGHNAVKTSLPFSTRIRFKGIPGHANIAAADRARAAALLHAHQEKRDGSPIDITNSGVTYTASVGVGTPATYYSLLIDTGSSNTWVGAGSTHYTATSSSVNTQDTVSVSYGSGSFSGEEWLDSVTISSDLVIQQQSIGVASSAQGFTNVDGILGVGPTALTTGTVGTSGQEIPTVTDNLYSQGSISSNSLGVYFVPASFPGGSSGELNFGGVDIAKTTSEVNFVPITTTSPASNYWGIDQSISYGDYTNILSSTAGIVDTGTTLVLLASDAYTAYQAATGASPDQTTGLLKISASQYNNLQSLYFNIGGQVYELPPNAQIWPRALNGEIGGDSSSVYLIIGDIGSNSGSGLDFINGYTFLERFYSVFDTENHQVGFATTEFTDITTN